MKHQIPNSKSQRNSKSQVSRKRRAVSYLESSNQRLYLNEAPSGNGAISHPFDLEERTAQFGEAIVRFSKKIPRNPTNNRLIDQLVGCGTSVGANYCEADERVSKKDFRNVIGRCVKEAKETKHFLRMIAAAEPTLMAEARSALSRSEGTASDFCEHLSEAISMSQLPRHSHIGVWSLGFPWGLGFGTWVL